MKEKGKILVIGGGISGITTAIEASEVGRDVILIENLQPSVGEFPDSISIFQNFVLQPADLKLITDVCVPILVFKFTPTLKSFRFPEKQGISKSKSGKTQLL